MSEGMGTHQPKGEDHYQCREVKAERDALRQRIAELEAENKWLREDASIYIGKIAELEKMLEIKQTVESAEKTIDRLGKKYNVREGEG